MLALGAGFLASAALLAPAGDAGATRIEYYATVGDKLCDMSLVKSGLAYCDVEVGTGAQPPRGELINVSAQRTVSCMPCDFLELNFHLSSRNISLL